MTIEKQEFSMRYTALMLEYAESFTEAPLLAIEQLGMEMVASDIPPEDLGEIHDTAIAELMGASQATPERIRAASLPLMQLLMAYGIAFREVRARREIEKDLVESEKQYKKLFESSRDAIIILDETGFIDGNQEALRMFGCHTYDDFKCRHPSDFSPPTQPCEIDSVTLANRHIAMALKEGSARFEWMHRRLNGDVFPAEVLLSALELNGNKVLQGTVRDITERKHNEEALKEIQTRYEDAQNIAQLGHWVLTLDKHELAWSDQIYRIFEVDPTKFGTSYDAFIDIVHPDDRELVNSTYEKSVQDKIPYNIEHRLLMKDGRVKWVNERCQTVYNEDGKPLRSIGTVLDITERKQNEILIHQTASILEMVTKGLPAQEIYDAIAHMYEGRHSGMRCSMLELKGGKLMHGGAPSLPEEYRKAVHGLQNGPNVGSCGTSTYTGKRVLVEDIATDPKWTELKSIALHAGLRSCWSEPIKNAAGKVIGAFGMYYNHPALPGTQELKDLFSAAKIAGIVMEREQREVVVRKLSSAVGQAGESIMITDKKGKIEYVNPAFTKITGYSAQEAIGETPRLLKSGNQDKAFYTAMWKSIIHGYVWHGKVIDKRKDGRFFPAMLTISPIVNEHGKITHFVGTHSDLTELENLEQQFYQAQKMEAIGSMVGGIAHNFNNMLAGMTGNLYLAKKRVQNNPDVVQRLTNVEELSHHAAEMIQQLLAFARKGIVSIKEMPLTPFINETLKLLSVSVPENIALHQDLCADDFMIKGDATQLHQVLANLINNACDAIEGVDKPCIMIKLELFQADADFIENHPYFKSADYALLSVADNGMGIAKSHLEHLFEPFFTTKEQGKGTGLGLSMIYGAIKTHHGFVEVESSSGNGSNFQIYIPLLEEKELSGDTEHVLKAIEGQGELILLVDDDQVMREVMTEVLESMKYKVIVATDGLEGFHLFKAHEQEISIALLDLIMPNVGGVELAEQIRAMKPELPVIFMTGYDQGLVLAGDTQIQNSKTFSKPLDFNVLSHNIRKMLE